MPSANTQAMQHHLDEIARNLAPKADAVLVRDQVGWHTTDKLRLPENLSLLPLPPKSPELNRSRMSGSSCDRPDFPIASSMDTRPS